MEGKVRDLPLGAALFVRVFAPGLGSSSLNKESGPMRYNEYIYMCVCVCLYAYHSKGYEGRQQVE